MYTANTGTTSNPSPSIPLKDPRDASLTDVQSVTPRSQVHAPAPVILTSALSNAAKSSAASADTTYGDATSDRPRFPLYSFGRKSAQPDDVKSKRVKVKHGFFSRRDLLFNPSESSDIENSIANKSTRSSSGRGAELWTETIEAHTDPHSSMPSLRIDSGSTPFSLSGWTTAGVDVSGALENDNECLSDIAFRSNESSAEKKCDPKRPYTSSLRIPDRCGYGLSPNLSVITDAGDQQQLRQEHDNAQDTGAENVEFDIQLSLASLLPNNSRHELQTEILKALQSSRIGHGFLPRGELSRLVNRESVARILMEALSESHTPKHIQDLVDIVCSETEVVQRGQKKIKTFRKSFILLAIVEIISSVPLFIEEDVSDLDLPLVWIPAKYNGTYELGHKAASGKQSGLPLGCFKSPRWSPIKLLDFYDYQWRLLAPFFSQDNEGDVKHYLLEDKHIMPFVASQGTEDEAADKTVGFARVFVVNIHKDHHNFRDKILCNRGFAIKQQLNHDDRKAFKNEISILKKFRGERHHRHIVSLLATYEQSQKLHLIFYRAEGDLFTYWKFINSEPVLDYRNVIWVAEQCHGLAEGLSMLHGHQTNTKCQTGAEEGLAHYDTVDIDQTNRRTHRHVRRFDRTHDQIQLSDSLERPASPLWMSDQTLSTTEELTKPSSVHNGGKHKQSKKYGRHGDINPGNILWYDDSNTAEAGLKGTLKLADFGQAEMNCLLRRTQPRAVANTVTYRPPECDLQPKIVSQSYDIWCLGCVYLEFVTWIVGGNGLLTAFAKRRLKPDMFHFNVDTHTFFQVTKNGETNHSEVMIKEEVTLFIDELHQLPNCSKFFHDFLDMIQYKMLVVQSKEREDCERIWMQLSDMHRKCLNSEEYATTGVTSGVRREIPHAVKFGLTRETKRVIEKNSPVHLAQPPRQIRRRWKHIDRRNAQ